MSAARLATFLGNAAEGWLQRTRGLEDALRGARPAATFPSLPQRLRHHPLTTGCRVHWSRVGGRVLGAAV
jgi:hypothetical protein